MHFPGWFAAREKDWTGHNGQLASAFLGNVACWLLAASLIALGADSAYHRRLPPALVWQAWLAAFALPPLSFILGEMMKLVFQLALHVGDCVRKCRGCVLAIPICTISFQCANAEVQMSIVHVNAPRSE